MSTVYARTRTACRGGCRTAVVRGGEEYHHATSASEGSDLMTTAAPRRDVPTTLEEVAERTHEVWTAYRDSLRDLSGRDYDDAEHRAWERLQSKLRDLEERRSELEELLAQPRA
jgi:hypothetical protein